MRDANSKTGSTNERTVSKVHILPIRLWLTLNAGRRQTAVKRTKKETDSHCRAHSIESNESLDCDAARLSTEDLLHDASHGFLPLNKMHRSVETSSEETTPYSKFSELSSRSATTPLSWCRDLEESLARLGLEDRLEASPTPSSSEDGDLRSDTVVFEEKFLRHLGDGSRMFLLPADHLLTLMYYNVFRALVHNVHVLNLDRELMHNNSYPSPWISNNINTITDLTTVPPQLRPTRIQSTVPHHPCFDLPPDPALRDNGILNSTLLPHGKLCLTLAGRETWYEKELLKRNGLVVWGEPDRIESWEATDGFVSTYPWLVVDAFALQKSTNAWRALRGEPPMTFA